MTETVSCRMKNMSDDGHKPKAPTKTRKSRKPRPLRASLQRHSANMNNTVPAKTNSTPRTPYWWQNPSLRSSFSPSDYELLSSGNKKSLRLRQRPSIPAQSREIGAYSWDSEAKQLLSGRLVGNKYNHHKPREKGSMFSFDVNKQINHKFGIEQDFRSQVQGQEQSLYQIPKDQRSQTSKLWLKTQKYSAFKVARPVNLLNQRSPSVEEVLKKLNKKVNKLFSWQISELDLVARLVGEIQDLKRPRSHSSCVSSLQMNPLKESLISTRLGKIILTTLSDSLQKISLEAPEESKKSPLSHDNLNSLKNEIGKLSKSLKAMAGQNEKVQIVENYDAKASSQLRERPQDTTRSRYLPKTIRQLNTTEPAAINSVGKLNEQLMTQISEKVDTTTLTLPVSKSMKIIPKSPQNIPPEVGYWITELIDEISTSKMTLMHAIELTTDAKGMRSQEFGEFVHMIESCHMLQPMTLTDDCTNWLGTASVVQVDFFRELVQIIQSVKQFIKSLAEAEDFIDIRNIYTSIQRSGVLDLPLPSLNSNINRSDVFDHPLTSLSSAINISGGPDQSIPSINSDISRSGILHYPLSSINSNIS